MSTVGPTIVGAGKKIFEKVLRFLEGAILRLVFTNAVFVRASFHKSLKQDLVESVV